MACDLTTVQESACTSGIGKVRNPTQLLQIIAQLLCDEAGGGSSPLVYRALLTQSGTNAPAATVLENSLGGTLVWSRSNTGQYSATLAGAFPAGKVFLSILASKDSAAPIFAATVRVSDNVIAVDTADSLAGTYTDDYLENTSFQILVYP